MDVTGEWKGFYRDPGNSVFSDDDDRFPILATFECVGGKLTGHMIDERETTPIPYADIVANIRQSHSEEYTREEIREMEAVCIQSPNLKYEIDLPQQSTIRGKVKGESVSFIKEYVGPHTTGWRDGDDYWRNSYTEKHRIRYEGFLIEGGQVIAGNWTIVRRVLDLIAMPKHSGAFRLERQ